MKTFAAKEAKDSFGLLLDTARQEPVTIEKKGRPVAVLLSVEEYARLEALEDGWWAAQAEQALVKGFVDAERSEKLLLDALNEKN